MFVIMITTEANIYAGTISESTGIAKCKAKDGNHTTACRIRH